MALTERASHLLRTLVEVYIREGRPVGSKTLSKETGVQLGPASIRNIMSELEEKGFLSSPHTSAGRVPTSKGYRLFVDGLITICPQEVSRREQIESSMREVQGLSALAESASELLANITKMASLVMIPGREKAVLRQIEFLTLSKLRILVIMVVNQEDVQNKIITVERPYDEAELNEAANYINRHFSGRALESICTDIQLSLDQDGAEFNRLLAVAQDIVPKAIDKTDTSTDCIVTGQGYLVGADPDVDIHKLKAVLDTFTHKYEVLKLMQSCTEASGVNIFIGEEVGSNIIDGYSLVSAPYKADGSLIGVLAVLGPTRMPYQKIIPTVDITAKILSSTLNQNN